MKLVSLISKWAMDELHECLCTVRYAHAGFWLLMYANALAVFAHMSDWSPLL